MKFSIHSGSGMEKNGARTNAAWWKQAGQRLPPDKNKKTVKRELDG